MSGFEHDAPGTPADRWHDDPRWREVPRLQLDHDRLVVLAAHPDDESLGAGGLLATAGAQGLEVEVVLVTDGEASHPSSPTHTPERLRDVRRDEAQRALALLAPTARLTRLELPDGAVAGREEELVHRVVGLLGDARRTLLVAPWRRDGHPDHEAVGRAASRAAARTGAELWEYPIWFWHWGSPDTAPWPALATLETGPDQDRAKQAAIRTHRSQVAALSPAAGDEVLLLPAVLDHFAGPLEPYVREPVGDDTLDGLHRAGSEPWEAQQRWYERRKRALLLAALPRERFRRGLEVGCSTGVLTLELAGRCDELVALDSSPAALETARARLDGHDRDLGHGPGQVSGEVVLERRDVPGSWPDGSFDLVVLSEVGYFLSPVALDGVLDRLAASLTEDGVLVLCHWRHPVRGWPLDAAAVHERVRSAGLRPTLASYADRDVELLVLAHLDQAPEPSR